jgi:hypothetical protein
MYIYGKFKFSSVCVFFVDFIILLFGGVLIIILRTTKFTVEFGLFSQFQQILSLLTHPSHPLHGSDKQYT